MYTSRPGTAAGLATVFQAGGVLADASIANQSPSSIREAAAAKGVAAVKASTWARAHPLTTQVGVLGNSLGI
jgi:methylmalonyl-CoA mutase cobalamin-binding subunit